MMLPGMVPLHFHMKARRYDSRLWRKADIQSMERFGAAVDRCIARHAKHGGYTIQYKTWVRPLWQKQTVRHPRDPRFIAGSPFYGAQPMFRHEILDKLYPCTVEKKQVGEESWFILDIRKEII